jgi:hypothetical protein
MESVFFGDKSYFNLLTFRNLYDCIKNDEWVKNAKEVKNFILNIENHISCSMKALLHNYQQFGLSKIPLYAVLAYGYNYIDSLNQANLLMKSFNKNFPRSDCKGDFILNFFHDGEKRGGGKLEFSNFINLFLYRCKCKFCKNIYPNIIDSIIRSFYK